MRLIAFVLAAFVVSGPAAAEWKEFNSVSEGFGVVFPADPDVDEVAMFEVVPGKTVAARIYSVRYDNSLFKMTVVDGRDEAFRRPRSSIKPSSDSRWVPLVLVLRPQAFSTRLTPCRTTFTAKVASMAVAYQASRSSTRLTWTADYAPRPVAVGIPR
jgi:hypothetical protein